MRERPILFSAPMVRAILDGTKTQTRQVVKPQPVRIGVNAVMHEPCPYGQLGDRLWVREAWADLTATHGQRWERRNAETGLYERGVHPFAWYRADGDQPDAGGGTTPPERWRPSIHMPRWASRISLEVTGLRVERLQDISEADAIAEGVDPSPGIRGDDDLMVQQVMSAHSDMDKPMMPAPVARYVLLWDSINGKQPGVTNWNANPWVWVVEFKRAAPESEDCPG